MVSIREYTCFVNRTTESIRVVLVMVLVGALIVVFAVVGLPMGVSTAANVAGCENTAYITNYVSGSVTVIDTSANDVTGTIIVGSEPVGLVVTADGLRAHVANQGSATVSVTTP